MKTINSVLLIYAVFYIAIALMVLLIAVDEGCLTNCSDASFGDNNPYKSPITWAFLAVLLWPVPLMVVRAIQFMFRKLRR